MVFLEKAKGRIKIQIENIEQKYSGLIAQDTLIRDNNYQLLR